MNIEVKLFAYFREERGTMQKIQINEGSTVKNVLYVLDIKEDEVSLLFVNGRSTSLDQVLNEGDVVSLFPPVGGG